MTLIVVNGNFANMLKSFQLLCPSLYLSKSRKTLKKKHSFSLMREIKVQGRLCQIFTGFKQLFDIISIYGKLNRLSLTRSLLFLLAINLVWLSDHVFSIQNSGSQMFYKISVLKNFTKSRDSFYKIAGPWPSALLKKKTPSQVSSSKIFDTFKNIFLRNISTWLFLGTTPTVTQFMLVFPFISILYRIL